MSSPFTEAEAGYRLIDRQMRKLLRAASTVAAAGAVPAGWSAGAGGLSREASILLEAAFRSFRSPPSGAALVVVRREVGPGSWAVDVSVVYPPLGELPGERGRT